MQDAWDVLLPVLAFLLGGIPFAFVVGKMSGVDLRRVGSGNIGAGNLTRQVGLGAGVTAAVLDGLKGLVPVLVGHRLGASPGVLAASGLAAVAGNNWSIYFKGRGGRGLATSVGVLVGIDAWLLLWPGLWAAAGWKLGGGIGGLMGWGLLPAYAVWLDRPGWVTATCAGLAMMMVLRRLQGNPGRAPGWQAALHRLLQDKDPADVSSRNAGEPARP